MKRAYLAVLLGTRRLPSLSARLCLRHAGYKKTAIFTSTHHQTTKKNLGQLKEISCMQGKPVVLLIIELSAISSRLYSEYLFCPNSLPSDRNCMGVYFSGGLL